MNVINANTKISAVLKENPGALEAIISLSPKFTKLRNPLLRKIMAPRTSIATASKIGGCSVYAFLEKLETIGFKIEHIENIDETQQDAEVPAFMKNITTENVTELDVRPVLESGKDPLQIIMSTSRQLKAGQILKLINSFEPVPLIHVLEKQGFASYSETIDDNLVYTYFYKHSETKKTDPQVQTSSEDWHTILQRYEGNFVTVNVQNLEMPLPMLTILDELENLPEGKALYVYHKRIPVYLLPELQERKFEYRIKEISDSEVHLLIYRP